MRLLLNFILITLTILACTVEDIYLFFWPPQPNQIINLTIRSRRDFSFDQAEALDDKRKKALSQYIPVYRFKPENVETSKQKFKWFMNELVLYQNKKQQEIENLRKRLQEELEVSLTRADILGILKHRDLKNLLDGILTIEESVLQNKILSESQNLMGKNTIEIQNPNSDGMATHSVDDLMALDKAHLFVEEKVRQLFWQVDKRVLDPVLKVSLATLQPNLEFDQSENQKRLDQINREFPSKIVSYKPGEVLVPIRKTLNEKDLLLLGSYQKDNISNLYRDIPWILFIILFIVVSYNLFLSRILANGIRNNPPYPFLLSLLIITVTILKGCLVLTLFPFYFLPFCLLPILIISLNHGKITATGTTLVGAMLVSLFTEPVYNVLVFFTFGGLTAVLVSSGLKKRLQILIPSFLVGIINALIVMFFNMDWQTAITQIVRLHKVEIAGLIGLFNAALITDISWAFIGGLIAGPLALLLLPLLEISSHTASSFKLNRYMDLHRPLLKELLSEAPGTYQHSMTVAYLAQSAGEAIGANTQLLRIAAYYHDIGKMKNPKHFIENQFNGENLHDTLDPHESAKIIINHVHKGLRIVQENRLPKAVMDLILQHHGTQLMEYFHDAAAKANPSGTIADKDFRYPGPKPQSVEAAILMVADAVEAASRSMQDPTRKKFDKMVRLILVKRIVDGQFSECDLTSRDLNKIVLSLVDSLEASFHSRIRYPWQEKKKPQKKKVAWRIGAKEEKDQEDRAFRL